MNQMKGPLFTMMAVLISAGGLLGCSEELLAEERSGSPGGDESPGLQPGGTALAAPQDPLCQRRGMTWRWWGRTNDVDSVGSDSTTNAYGGDTTCNVSLPILCIRRVGAAKPSYITSSFYNGWTGGYIALTKAHVGYDIGSAAGADAICASELGAGWEMAEFHDGSFGNGGGRNGGWNFQAYGAATHPDRFWVMIDDQPANCWNSTCSSIPVD